MREYFILFGLFFFNLWAEIRKTFWKFFISKIFKTGNFKLSKQDKIKLYNHGDIALKLYSAQPLTLINRGFEYKTLNIIKSSIKNGDVVLDIGANIGIYSVVLSRLIGSTGKVYAFEPDPITAEFLKKNLELNNCNNVTVIQAALSDENSKIILRKPEGGGDAFNYISKNIENAKSKENIIDSIRLDDFIQENNISKIDFIKIDVEGAELLSFRGAFKLLSEIKPIIITECYEPYLQRFGHKIIDLVMYLNQFGYDFTNYDEHQWYLKKKVVTNVKEM
jgi:FkbM family methyltransferase